MLSESWSGEQRLTGTAIRPVCVQVSALGVPILMEQALLLYTGKLAVLTCGVAGLGQPIGCDT